MSEKPVDRQEELKRCMRCHFARTTHRYNASTLNWDCTACEKREQLKKELAEKQEQFKRELAEKQEKLMKRLERHSKKQD